MFFPLVVDAMMEPAAHAMLGSVFAAATATALLAAGRAGGLNGRGLRILER